MRKLKRGCCRRVSILDGSITSVLNTRTDALTVAPLAIRSASASTVKNGILTISVHSAKESVLVYGAHRTIFTRSALIFKRKTKNKQNVQTAMKHILHGPKPVRLS